MIRITFVEAIPKEWQTEFKEEWVVTLTAAPGWLLLHNMASETQVAFPLHVILSVDGDVDGWLVDPETKTKEKKTKEKKKKRK